MPEEYLSGDSDNTILRKILTNQATGGGGGSGTVTSVGLSMPSQFNVSGSPVTTSGTIAVTLATQAANVIFAGPTSGGAAAPTFRALVAADLGTLLDTYVTAASTFGTDNLALRADGTGRGSQSSGLVIADVAANNLTIRPITNTALTLATADNNRNIVLSPHGTGQIRLETTSGGVRLPSTNTAGLLLYNTADETTNYERLSLSFASNVAYIGAQSSGTGTPRQLRLIQGDTNGPVINLDISTRSLSFYAHVNLTTLATVGTGITSAGFNFTGLSSTATSGALSVVTITPTYNQTSGTAANTDLLVNRTETAVGSGTQNLIDLRVGGTSRFAVRNTGALVVANQTSGAGAAAGTLANAPSVGDPDFWWPVSINGTQHWVPAWAA